MRKKEKLIREFSLADKRNNRKLFRELGYDNDSSGAYGTVGHMADVIKKLLSEKVWFTKNY